MGRASDAKLRAQVIADLATGEQPAIVAERYGIPAGRVRIWKARYVTDVTEPVTPVTVERPSVERQKQTIGALIVDLLAAKLEASKAIAEAVHNAEWLAKQSAADLAALGDWLDGSALAIGDRLAGQRPDSDPGE